MKRWTNRYTSRAVIETFAELKRVGRRMNKLEENPHLLDAELHDAAMSYARRVLKVMRAGRS